MKSKKALKFNHRAWVPMVALAALCSPLIAAPTVRIEAPATRSLESSAVAQLKMQMIRVASDYYRYAAMDIEQIRQELKDLRLEAAANAESRSLVSTGKERKLLARVSAKLKSEDGDGTSKSEALNQQAVLYRRMVDLTEKWSAKTRANGFAAEIDAFLYAKGSEADTRLGEGETAVFINSDCQHYLFPISGQVEYVAWRISRFFTIFDALLWPVTFPMYLSCSVRGF